MGRRTMIDVGFCGGTATDTTSAGNNATATRVNRDHPQQCFSQKRILSVPSISLVPCPPSAPARRLIPQDDRPFRR